MSIDNRENAGIARNLASHAADAARLAFASLTRLGARQIRVPAENESCEASARSVYLAFLRHEGLGA